MPCLPSLIPCYPASSTGRFSLNYCSHWVIVPSTFLPWIFLACAFCNVFLKSFFCICFSFFKVLWSVVDLQCHSHFCCTTKQLSYTCVHFIMFFFFFDTENSNFSAFHLESNPLTFYCRIISPKFDSSVSQRTPYCNHGFTGVTQVLQASFLDM